MVVLVTLKAIVMSFNFLICATLLLLAAYPASSEVYFKKGSPQVDLSEKTGLSGSVKLSRDGQPYAAFVGIPYGHIPNRFEASMPFPLWEGVKPATKQGTVCAQQHFGDGAGEYGGEDCLNLNVYIPLKNTEKKRFPVMVWIHGGGFQYGEGFGYGAKYFMDEDVILVTLNYRLGVLGFLNTGDGLVPGNNGLKDQRLALRWVQENIEKFGGAKDEVTIFGESAGGASVHFQLLSPSTEGLFRRAISQSNSAASVICYDPNPRQNAVKLANYLKCPTSATEAADISSEEIVDCFRKLPAKKLIDSQFEYKHSFPLDYYSFYFVPTSESKTNHNSKDIPFMTESPLVTMANKDKPLKNVPWMTGVTEDEGCSMYSGLVLHQPKLMEEMDTKWDEMVAAALHYDKFIPCPMKEQSFADKVRKFYFENKKISLDTRDNLTNLYSDSSISYGVYRSAMETASRGEAPVYLYQYAYSGPISIFGLAYEITEKEAKMVGHGDDIQHQFVLGEIINDEDVGEIIQPDTEDEVFSKNFVKLWASFAIHGEPRHTWGKDSLKQWKPVTTAEATGRSPLQWYRIESNPTIIKDAYKERFKFWDEIYDEFVLNTHKNSRTEL